LRSLLHSAPHHDAATRVAEEIAAMPAAKEVVLEVEALPAI
jgi:hypothetical protein